MARGDETVLQGGRAKAYRPLPEPERRKALEAGLEAYARDDWFLAHELLEPAWMGTRDLAERELLQGLIKLAAAFVHGARSNPAGVAKNLRGARARIEAGLAAGAVLGVDAHALLESLDAWLAAPGPRAIAIPRYRSPGERPGRREKGAEKEAERAPGKGTANEAEIAPGNGAVKGLRARPR